MGVHSPAFTPQALLLGARGGEGPLQPRAPEGRQPGGPGGLGRCTCFPESHPLLAGPCHGDAGLALTSLDRSCHIWLPGSPPVDRQDPTPQPWGSGTTQWHMPPGPPS